LDLLREGRHRHHREGQGQDRRRDGSRAGCGGGEALAGPRPAAHRANASRRPSDPRSYCRNGAGPRQEGPAEDLRPASIRVRDARGAGAVGRAPALDRQPSAGECGVAEGVMTHPIDRADIIVEMVAEALAAAGKTAPARLRSDLEGIRNIYFASLEARPIKERRQETQRTIKMAKALRKRLSIPFDAPLHHWPARELRDFSFVRALDAFIANRERDLSPPAVLNVYSASAFENAVAMLADRWRFYFDEKPSYSTTT